MVAGITAIHAAVPVPGKQCLVQQLRNLAQLPGVLAADQDLGDIY